jgi:hypothetical protein
MSVGSLSDESLRRYYESIRDHVAADLRSGHHYLMGDPAKAWADDLLAEIQRRRLDVAPILWPN